MIPLETIRGHTFFPYNLGPGSVIIDAGANIGDFSRECASRFGCTPFAIEPNPASAAQITTDRVFGHALSAETSTQEFFVGPNPEGCSLSRHPEHTSSMKVPVIGFHEFLAQHGLKSVDLLKLDIEGAELELLSALTSPSNIAQITVEFHDFMFPETHPQVTRTIQHMKAIGFRCFNFTGPRNQDVLFLNPRMVRLPLGSTLRAYARVVARRCGIQLPSAMRGAVTE